MTGAVATTGGDGTCTGSGAGGAAGAGAATTGAGAGGTETTGAGAVGTARTGAEGAGGAGVSTTADAWGHTQYTCRYTLVATQCEGGRQYDKACRAGAKHDKRVYSEDTIRCLRVQGGI